MGSKGVRRGTAVVAVGVLALLSACSSEGTSVSDDIATQAKSDLDLSTAPGVTCPDDAKAEDGAEFTCDLDLAGETVPVKVTFDGSEPTLELQGKVYPKKALDESLKADLAKNGLELKTLSCGSGELVAFSEKTTVSCTATTTDGGEGKIAVHLGDKGEAETNGSVYAQTAIVDFLMKQLAEQVTVTEIDCGPDALIQAEEDTSIDCEATADDGSTATLKVTLGSDGTATLDDVVTE